MAECEHIEACRMAYGGEGCKPACDLDLPCHLYKPRVDRDALLKLADELKQETGSVCGVCMGRTANRIYKALGVES